MDCNAVCYSCHCCHCRHHWLEVFVDGMATIHLSNFQGVHNDLHLAAVIIGGVFALIALVLSCFLILQHLKAYTNPPEQKWLIGVIFMVPIYACESIISLWNPRLSVECDILRNCYEAFALYCFGSYLIACLGGERRVVELLENAATPDLSEPFLSADKPRKRECSFRNFFCHPNSLGEYFYTIVKFGIVQYMILKTFCAFLALVLELFGVYGDGEFKWYYGYPYIAVVLNFSQMWALYCLVQFYTVTHDMLKPIKPLAKFISFKAIVFATWWQGVGIALVCYFGVLPEEGKIQHGIQDFLICIEMAIAAVVHIFAFSTTPYKFLPASDHGRIITEETKTEVQVKKDCTGKPTLVEEKEHKIKAPGTSVAESVQDVFLGGGERVVKDVVLTITQAVEPVEKGVTKIQEKFQSISMSPNSEEKGKTSEYEVEEHVEEDITESGPQLINEEKVVRSRSFDHDGF